jgi:hypothetical protein
VKPGVVQCVCLNHPDRRDGKKACDPFLIPCHQGLKNVQEHLRTQHGVVFEKVNHATIQQAFAGESKKKTLVDGPVKVGTRVFTKMVCEDRTPFAMVERSGFRGVISAISEEINREITVPSRHQVTKDVDNWYSDVVEIEKCIGGNEEYCPFFQREYGLLEEFRCS